jgi:hypothetical protein
MANGTDFLQNPFGGNVFADFLEQEGVGQRSAFFGALPQNQTANQQTFFQNQFQPTLDQFLGLLGQQINAGQTPTQRFNPFVQSFPFAQNFASLPPSQRPGLPQRIFAPQARSFFF